MKLISRIHCSFKLTTLASWNTKANTQMICFFVVHLAFISISCGFSNLTLVEFAVRWLWKSATVPSSCCWLKIIKRRRPNIPDVLRRRCYPAQSEQRVNTDSWNCDNATVFRVRVRLQSYVCLTNILFICKLYSPIHFWSAIFSRSLTIFMKYSTYWFHQIVFQILRQQRYYVADFEWTVVCANSAIRD